MNAAARKIANNLAFIPSAVLMLLSITCFSFAQTTVGTGSIVRIVSDPSGAVIKAAKIAITNTATGQIVEITTNSSGSFNSGALIPGNYKTQVSAPGFSSAEGGFDGPLWRYFNCYPREASRLG